MTITAPTATARAATTQAMTRVATTQAMTRVATTVATTKALKRRTTLSLTDPPRSSLLSAATYAFPLTQRVQNA